MNDLKAALGKPPKAQDEDRKMAKMKALKDLKDTMSKHMGKGLTDSMSMKKVTVAAPNKEKLAEGLDIAKEVTEAMPEDDSEISDNSGEEAIEQDVSDAIDKVEDPSEIDALMKMLEEKKKALLAKA